MGFGGWGAEAVEFFEGLEADNSKAYWEDHKATYERSVRGRVDELLRELEAEFGPGKLFRPYRDVRFSRDKSPYKTNIAAMVGEAGYVSLSATGLGVGSGMLHMATDQLDRYRRAVDDDGTGGELASIAAALQRQGQEFVAHARLKTAPRGYAKDHLRLELLQHKGLATWRQWPPAAWLGTRKARDRIVEALRAGLPLRQWLDTHVGATTMDQTRR